MNQIVMETKITKYKVNYLINDWKNNRDSYIDKIREFGRLARKLNVLIEQYAPVFRMTNILKIDIENSDDIAGAATDFDNIVDNRGKGDINYK